MTMLLSILIFALALWLGLYLLARNPEKRALLWAGLGLVTYAGALASDALSLTAPNPMLAQTLARFHWALILWPATLWVGVLLEALPTESSPRAHLIRAWRYGLLPGIALCTGSIFASSFIVDFALFPPQPGGLYVFAALLVLSAFFLALGFVAREFYLRHAKNSHQLLIIAAFLFALSTALFIAPFNWLSRDLILWLIGIDLELLGIALAILDAFDEGESWLPDLARSFVASAFMATLFGGFIVLSAVLEDRPTFSTLVLLFAITAAAIATQVFADPIQTWLDRLTFARLPQLRQARTELREVSSALPRAPELTNPLALDEAEFARVTRRAISHLGDLPKLATNPLVQLPLVQSRVAQRGLNGNALERAAELRLILTESIARLRPQGKGEFGTSDEWRHYNALHFPYVIGLKPYSLRADHDDLPPAAQKALEWFRATVPERTLYNWQNAAAKLIAHDLLECHQRSGSPQKIAR